MHFSDMHFYDPKSSARFEFYNISVLADTHVTHIPNVLYPTTTSIVTSLNPLLAYASAADIYTCPAPTTKYTP